MAQSCMGSELSSDVKTQITALHRALNHVQDLALQEDDHDHLLVVVVDQELLVEGLHRELLLAEEASQEVQRDQDHDHDHQDNKY